ncbi:MAG TPA: DinB family protein [Pyrinomonadaceae bacterium]|nr:DinB family protein [Pyrinomonadaceae bacterium]
MSKRSEALADRLVQGATALENFAAALTQDEWEMRTPKDGRKIGVIVNHVATVYPLEIEFAQMVARGEAVTDLTANVVNKMNAEHAKANDGVTKEQTLELLHQNSTAAAAAIRALSDAELDQAVPVTLYGGATVTCQFVLEDHAVRHSYHHLARLRSAVQSVVRAA